MGVIGAICGVVGAFTIGWKVIAPIVEGTILGIKDYRDELKAKKEKDK